MLPDVRAIGCDFLACSAYKFYGPHIGILYGRHDLLESLNIPKLQPAHDNAPDKVETGTLNHEGIAGAAAAVNFIASLAGVADSRRDRLEEALGEIHDRGGQMLSEIWNGLSAIQGVTVYGLPPGEKRTPTIAFTVEGVHSRDVARQLATRGVFVSHGDFYAMTVVERLGLKGQGLVRAGCAIYTNDDEVARLIEGVRSIRG
jgi:selenocysteine lyase/cysteine desulfurase